MLLVAVIAWLALSLQLFIVIKNAASNGLSAWMATWNFFSYFTVLTNLLVAVALSFVLLAPSSFPARFVIKSSTIGAIALYILIVGVVYNSILRFIWEPVGLQRWVDEALHVAVPLLFVLFWLLFVPKGRLRRVHPFHWLFPAVYLMYALLRGAYPGFYAYPFIDSRNLGYGRVFQNIAGLMVVFIATGFLFLFVDRKLANARN